jgi:hypothetical protein
MEEQLATIQGGPDKEYTREPRFFDGSRGRPCVQEKRSRIGSPTLVQVGKVAE